jgi:hypothetical protein
VTDPSLVDSVRQQARPRGLTAATLLLVVGNLTSFIDPTWMDGGPTLLWFSLAVIFASFIVIGYFWLGRGWARWLVLAVSVLSLVVLVMWASLTAVEKATAVFDALLGVWLLYWLNTGPVLAYFGRRAGAPRPSALALVGIGLLAVVLLICAILIIMISMEPTPRPVFDEKIDASHRETLAPLLPEGERILGLYSKGMFDVAEEGCLFTGARLLIYRDAAVSRQAHFTEIQDIRVERNTDFGGLSQVIVRRVDGNEVYCELPNAADHPNDAAEFHERLMRTWKGEGP